MILLKIKSEITDYLTYYDIEEIINNKNAFKLWELISERDTIRLFF